jgi:hypothetical protein
MDGAQTMDKIKVGMTEGSKVQAPDAEDSQMASDDDNESSGSDGSEDAEPFSKRQKVDEAEDQDDEDEPQDDGTSASTSKQSKRKPSKSRIKRIVPQADAPFHSPEGNTLPPISTMVGDQPSSKTVLPPINRYCKIKKINK